MCFSRQLQYCCSAFGLAVTTLISPVAPSAHAQIIYVSDNRSVSAAVGIDTNANSISLGGLATVTYSGNYSGSASPSSPYADFNSSLAGTANVSSAYNGVSNYFSFNVTASQNSSLGAQGISYLSGVHEGDNYPNQNAPYSQISETSSFQVSFMVATTTPYDLTLTRGIDPSFSQETWSLTSANFGSLVSGPPPVFPGGPTAEGTFNYSGMFNPGDVYTLTMYEHAAFHGGAPSVTGEEGDLQALLEVPEPESSFLLGMGALCLIAARHRRKSEEQVRLAAAPARSRSI